MLNDLEINAKVCIFALAFREWPLRRFLENLQRDASRPGFVGQVTLTRLLNSVKDFAVKGIMLTFAGLNLRERR